MTKISGSPQRGTFQSESYREKLVENPDDTESKDMIDMYDQMQQDQAIREEDPEWQKDNMEYDLRTCPWMLEKVRVDEVYAQHLYASICNRDFQKNETWPILQDKKWSASWRHAGGIIADMRQVGDYIEWYCSSMRDQDLDEEQISNLTPEQLASYDKIKQYVTEGVVTDEIRIDLLKLGWIVLDDDGCE